MAVNLGYYTIAAPDIERAKRFYGGVFGWSFHPESAHIQGSDPAGGLNPGDGGPTPKVWFAVDDIAACVARVRELGGQAEEAQSSASGGGADCLDDQGVAFSLHEPARGLLEDYGKELFAHRQANPGGQPQLGYYSIPTPDVERAMRFYGSLFERQFDETSTQYAHIVDSTPPGGIHADDAATWIRSWFRVEDIQAVAQRVRSAGGTAEEPRQSQTGWNCDCRDDQLMEFSLWQPAPGLAD